ncbi:hypothetical protein SAMN02745206_01464 [Desulfacinum infernum DSM 9756]|uniref:Uncharacterized protein n=1 Tax=Desulfacinum infernum DSM 9756 TaxID=1121391 RepID=A0A1M4ZHA0_9BACT|nr:hypothetical protein [Desulfacinum infernum]SHF17420.1 hypothetical protein SAMN02745206_01464 [Desulfacinum infernum DSM 9756]
MKALFCDGRLGAGTGARLRAVVFSLVCCCLSAFSGCTPVVSKGLLARTRDVSFEEVLRRPAQYSGQKEEPVYCYPPPYPWHPWWYHPYPWL